MDITLLLFSPDRYAARSLEDSRSLLPTALVVLFFAPLSLTLAGLLFSPGRIPASSLLLPVFLLRLTGNAALAVLWSAWIWFVFSVLTRAENLKNPSLFTGLLITSFAPGLFAAGFALPLALLLPRIRGLSGILFSLLGLWILCLQAGMLKRLSGLSTPATAGLLLASGLLLGLFLSLAPGGAIASLILKWA